MQCLLLSYNLWYTTKKYKIEIQQFASVYFLVKNSNILAGNRANFRILWRNILTNHHSFLKIAKNAKTGGCQLKKRAPHHIILLELLRSDIYHFTYNNLDFFINFLYFSVIWNNFIGLGFTYCSSAVIYIYLFNWKSLYQFYWTGCKVQTFYTNLIKISFLGYVVLWSKAFTS